MHKSQPELSGSSAGCHNRFRLVFGKVDQDSPFARQRDSCPSGNARTDNAELSREPTIDHTCTILARLAHSLPRSAGIEGVEIFVNGA